jgi:hypothetical protein
MAFMPRASHVLQWRLQIDAKPQGGANRKKVASVQIAGWQLACMKLESLVIANQLRRGECVPEPCTHRPSSDGSWEYPKSGREPARDAPAYGKPDDWH